MLFFLAAGVATWLYPAWLLTSLGRALVRDDGPRRADAIVVLGGDDFGSRIIKAAQLEQAGYAPLALVSAPPVLLGHESDLTIAYAGQKGYPASLFRAAPIPAGESTRSEALLLGKQLKAAGIRRILLVTSNYHTRRAARLWESGNPWLEIHTVAAPDPYFTPDGWWKSRSGKKTFLYEWMKTIASGLGQ